MPAPKTYEACYVPDAIIIPDGILAKPAWERANIETDFSFPWEERLVPRTEFRALFDASAFYFSFCVDDEDIVLVDSFRTKEDVVREDRVELFFALDRDLAQYFCLEIDPLGRVLDYRASHYRKFDFSWSFPGLDVVGQRTRAGYVVEGLIRWETFQRLGFPPPDSGRTIKLGIYRAEFQHTEGRQWREGWISWVDPRTEQPDFHVPESFGELKMVW